MRQTLLNRRCFITGLSSAFVILGTSQAHRLPLTVTTLKATQGSTGTLINITHRLHLHDCIEVMAKQGHGVSMHTLEDQARMALYIEERFLLRDIEQQPIKLETIGADVEGDYFYLYQSVTLAPHAHFEIKSDVFADLAADWLHHINIDKPSGIASLDFSGRAKWKAVTA